MTKKLGTIKLMYFTLRSCGSCQRLKHTNQLNQETPEILNLHQSLGRLSWLITVCEVSVGGSRAERGCCEPQRGCEAACTALGWCSQEGPVDDAAEVFPKPADTASSCKKENQAVTENILNNKYHLLCWAHRLNGLESEQTLGDS